MSKLADAIQRTLRIDSIPMGFGAARAAPKASMLVGLISTAAAVEGADVLLLELSAFSREKIATARTAAGSAALGVRIASVDAAGARAAKAAGADFLLVEADATPAAALLEEDLGYVLALPSQMDDAFLRSLEALNLEALYLDSVPSPLTIARQIELNRIAMLGRKPLVCKVAASATKEELQCLRNAGCAAVLTAGAPADAAKLRETVMSLPPRRQRREDRPVVSLPRGRAAAAADDDDDDDDD